MSDLLNTRSAMASEPIAIINTVTALIEAILIVGVSFGLSLSSEQVVAVMAAVVALGAVIQTVLGRSQVFSRDTVDEVVGNVVRNLAPESVAPLPDTPLDE